MLKYIIIFAYLFSSSLSTYRVMSKKSIDFGNDICLYQETDDSNDYLYYVKPCPDGQYCSNFEPRDYMLSKCQTYSQLKTTLNGNCQTDFECGNDYNSGTFDLECTGSNEKHCTVKSSSIYTIEDIVSNEKKYFCHPDKVAILLIPIILQVIMVVFLLLVLKSLNMVINIFLPLLMIVMALHTIII